MRTASTPTCQYTRRVANDTAARTAGPAASPDTAASAPVVASAFHPALAPVGVLLAVLGYALGTYCAYLTAQMMRALAQ